MALFQSAPGTVLITGTTSGVGLYATKALVDLGWKVITANRSPIKAEDAAVKLGLPFRCPNQLQHIYLDLSDLESIRVETKKLLISLEQPLDALVCNAAVYMPRLLKPQRSPQGYELSMATNHFGHFLLIQLLLDNLSDSKRPVWKGRSWGIESSRIVMLGTVTANYTELGGKIPIPAPADLGDLSGFKQGFIDPISMASGKRFKPGKAYKDSKLCNMITIQELDRRYKDSSIVFSSLYPGCVANTKLFRNTPKIFQWLFPLFQRFITGGFVSQTLAGKRVAQVVSNPEFGISGVHWSWGNRQKKNGEQFSQKLSERITDPLTAKNVWELSMKLIDSN
ncbi:MULTISPECIES: protochlorophyllide reductase [unclassified Prochlorococcus]|uniref:protochlorophyllide reductase n=1 Tax=unclassified Prochlorococcus TaxID=2627481 RepID=UPI000533A1A9|nr:MULTISPECIES: protochlorophyllide reductase [unclassified Prochlorococcus]KGG16417.1 Light-dependent protochlorophyllide reductase [Prochlorococcus sp. MIT 0602]KGG17109.1 Light-dependent protochlorophyllide reductase [Prochlorococcus sp. MIT 0603]